MQTIYSCMSPTWVHQFLLFKHSLKYLVHLIKCYKVTISKSECYTNNGLVLKIVHFDIPFKISPGSGLEYLEMQITQMISLFTVPNCSPLMFNVNDDIHGGEVYIYHWLEGWTQLKRISSPGFYFYFSISLAFFNLNVLYHHWSIL